MKEKRLNKKIIFIFIAIILLVLILIVLFNNDIGKGMINNIKYRSSNSKVEKINKDIIISTEYKILLDEDKGYYLQEPETGYSSTTSEYYVDLKKSEIYYVEDYNVYQSGDKDYGHHYTIKNSKKLSDEEIEDFKSIENLNSDDDLSGKYYQITYKNKTIYTKLHNNVTIINILEELK